MAFGQFYGGWILDYFFGAGDPPVVASQTVALWIGDPLYDMSGGTEVSGNGYARVATGTGDWTSAVGPLSYENSSAITFPEAVGGDWGTVTHVVIIGDAFPMVYGPLLAEKEIPTGSIPRFAIGELTITLV